MLKKFCSLNVRTQSMTSQLFTRCFSKFTEHRDYDDQVAISEDKKTIVCWHPHKPFPYECSLPLPDVPIKEDHSVLKVQSTPALRNIHRPKPTDLERLELMKITHTTKHVWFPIARKVKRRKPNMDRPYL